MTLPSPLRWTPAGRGLVFLLSASSIWCLLAEFYGLCSMRAFALWVLAPATGALLTMAVLDRIAGDRRLWRAVALGLGAGVIAAIAYDAFRLPFVFAREWEIDSVVPPMPLFKVFPRFGAMLLGQPVEQAAYSPGVQALGWAYHFSNGATFGVMYLALIGEPTRRHWAWGVVMAVGIELAMLASPYTRFFAIPLTGLFVAVTIAAHSVFGAVMGLTIRAAPAQRTVP